MVLVVLVLVLVLVLLVVLVLVGLWLGVSMPNNSMNSGERVGVFGKERVREKK